MKPILTTTVSAFALALTFSPATAQKISDDLNRGVIDACRAILDAEANASANRNIMNGNGEDGLRADAGIQPGEQIPQAVPDYPNDAQAAEAMVQIDNEIDPLDGLQNPGQKVASTTQPDNGATTSTSRQVSEGAIAKTYDDFADTIDEPSGQQADATNPLRESSELVNEGLTGVEPGLNQQADRGDLDPVTNGDDPMNGGATAMGDPAAVEPDSEPIPAERDQTDLVERDGTATSERDRQMARNGSDQAQPAPTDRRSVQRAYQVASAVVPHVQFSGWQRTNESGSAYVFAGVNQVTGRPTAIYMTDGARVNEIRERIPLSAVPTDLRRMIGSEIEGLRVSSVARSLRSNLDVYFEFDGILRSGRPVAIEIRADGEDFTMNAPTNS